MKKICKKREHLLSARVELKTFYNDRGGYLLKNKLKIEKICQKRKKLLPLRVELKIFHNGRGG